ncbi:MAG: radical SAM protein [Anaerovoracaceae bacterium]|jgi:MoaA/NifB/PqqE/SkfB family radical SAM enzyme
MSIKDAAERKAADAAICAILKYVGKDTPEERAKKMVKLVDLMKKMLGDNFGDNFYDGARKMAADPNNKWSQFAYRMIDELDFNVARMQALNLGYQAAIRGTKEIRANRIKYGCNIPWLILMDPTSACNLRCTGCWAAEYGYKLNLSYEDMDRIVTQGKELGVYFYMFTGGEPLVRKDDIIKLCKKHHDCAFSAYTNGTLIDEEFCKQVVEVGNLSFSVSVEGFADTNDARRGDGVFDRVMHAMDLMKQYGIFFGVSVCYTRKNLETVVSDEFLDMLIDKGCRFGWYFHYMPVGVDADVDLMPTPEQREYIYNRIREIRGFEGGKQIYTMDFQNDGEYVGGCIAGGRNYFHINANGDAEPCVFIHYSSANIHKDSILDCLRQPLFMAYRDNQEFNENHLRPCPMLENPEILQRMVDETGAKSTDLITPEDVHELCGKCEAYAKSWKPVADRLWAEHPHHVAKYDNHKDHQKEYLQTEAGKKAYKKAMAKK